MAIKMCSNGHFYDDEKFFRCPYCGITLDSGDNERTQMRPGEMSEKIYGSDSDSAEEDDRTIAFWKETDDREYVTGWLVCISGPEKGRDFRIHYGFNRIGRSYNMDICVEDDLQITRDNHCSIVYDRESNAFSVLPSTGAVTYLNNAVLMQAETLKNRDRIRIGKSTFEFIAFCDGENQWEENMD